MISIRTMHAADIDLGLHLKDQAGWNQTAADWQRFLRLEPSGCFVAEWEGRAAGTTVVTEFGSVAWIAMVLVDEQLRGRGIGTRLVAHALEHLDARGVATVRLDATPLGRPIYQRLGFAADYDLARWQGIAPAEPAPVGVNLVADSDLAAVAELDARISATGRERLIRYLHRQEPAAMWCLRSPGNLLGYAALRTGSRAFQIGPAGAVDDAAGKQLLSAAAYHAHGRTVFLDIPEQNRPATAWAESRGLVIQRRFTRMTRGTAIHDQPALLWASSGPENG